MRRPPSPCSCGTFGELLAFEFGYWASHYVFHRIPALWEFHKVHHSAEVMTTLTEMRQHPIEIIVFMNVQALCTGMVFGLMTYLFGHVGHWALLDGNIVLGIFILTWGHLRHSHIWMPVQGLMGKLFQSPAHHQVHHSTDPRHFDKNLGFALAVWDWAFGTLHIPAREREVSHYGVGARIRGLRDRDALADAAFRQSRAGAETAAARRRRQGSLKGPAAASVTSDSSARRGDRRVALRASAAGPAVAVAGAARSRPLGLRLRARGSILAAAAPSCGCGRSIRGSGRSLWGSDALDLRLVALDLGLGALDLRVRPSARAARLSARRARSWARAVLGSPALGSTTWVRRSWARGARSWARCARSWAALVGFRLVALALQLLRCAARPLRFGSSAPPGVGRTVSPLAGSSARNLIGPPAAFAGATDGALEHAGLGGGGDRRLALVGGDERGFVAAGGVRVVALRRGRRNMRLLRRRQFRRRRRGLHAFAGRR